jgi:protein-L-isoaspartate(D-aspartate) O-methyltransferase
MREMSEAHFAVLRRHMVEVIAIQAELADEELGKATLDPRVLAAMANLSRHLFVPSALVSLAYHDAPLPIGFGKTISQPFVVAVTTDLLAPLATNRALEVGTGPGYQTAVLARLARRVWSVEVIEELALEAGARLGRLGYPNVDIRVGDGSRGWAARGPSCSPSWTRTPRDRSSGGRSRRCASAGWRRWRDPHIRARAESSSALVRRQAFELRRHDEVVLVQAFDLPGLQRDRGVAPAKGDVGMMALGLGELARSLDKAQRFAEVLEPVGALDHPAIVEQVPSQRLRQIDLCFLDGKRRYAAAARCAALRGKGVGHAALLDGEPAAESPVALCSATCGAPAH